MATPYKMKGSPMARNFGIGSPMKDDTYGPKAKHAKEEAERKSKLAKVENIGGGEKSIKKITDEGHEEYMKKGEKSFTEIAKKTEKKAQQVKSYNKSRANYLKYAASISKNKA
mgnify:CR=1 FL=1